MAAFGLSYQSDVATQQNNTTGVLSPILTIDPDDGTLLRFLNNFPTGDSVGLPIFADFQSGGTNMPTDSSLVLRVVRPTDNGPVPIAQKETNIASWNQLTLTEQRNEENIDAVKLELNGSRVNVRDKDVLRVEMNSSDQINWTNSQLYIPRQGVSRVPYEG